MQWDRRWRHSHEGMSSMDGPGCLALRPEPESVDDTFSGIQSSPSLRGPLQPQYMQNIAELVPLPLLIIIGVMGILGSAAHCELCRSFGRKACCTHRGTDEGVSAARIGRVVRREGCICVEITEGGHGRVRTFTIRLAMYGFVSRHWRLLKAGATIAVNNTSDEQWRISCCLFMSIYDDELSNANDNTRCCR